MINFEIYLDGKEAHNLFLTERKISCGEKMQFVLMLNEDTKIDTLDIVFLLDFTENALVFNNGFCTNDFVNVIKLDKELVSRDILMIKEDSKFFSIAMTSAENYLTRFISTKDKVILRHYFDGLTYKRGTYPLEEFVVSDELSGGEFFSLYCDFLKEKFNIKLPQMPDAGWSSWSCMYGTVTEDDVLKQAENTKKISEKADMIQIDDGWQNGGTFCGDWTSNKETFATGVDKLSKKFKENDQRLGLWFAPAVFANTGTLYKEHPEYNIFYENGETVRAFGGNQALCADNDGSVFPLDLENEKALKHIEDSFKNAVENYDCHYFKIDFLVRSLIRAVNGQNLTNVTYNSVPSVKAYKNAMRLIRKTVGDSFMMACGAPITESVGVFDAIRTSPDITWVWSTPPRPYTYWEIVRNNIQNVFLRSYYHGKVFLADADALVVRSKLGRKDDNFTPTLEEARTWATTVALSGGAVLINEEIEALEEERIELIKQVISPIGIAATPDDFFEFPYVTKVTLNADNKQIKAVYNWNETEKEDFIKNDKTVLAFDCWSKEFLGEFSENISLKIPPHGVRAILLIEKPQTDCVLCYTDDFYMGLTKDLCEKEGAYVFKQGEVKRIF